MANKIKFITGNSASFASLETKDSNALYFLTDTQQIYKGDVLYSDGLLVQPATFENWLARADEILAAGTILIYTDRTVVDGVNCPDIKIADGEKTVAALPFLTDRFMESAGIDTSGDVPVFKGRLNHSITIGEHIYDGTADVNIPIYDGE